MNHMSIMITVGFGKIKSIYFFINMIYNNVKEFDVNKDTA